MYQRRDLSPAIRPVRNGVQSDINFKLNSVKMNRNYKNQLGLPPKPFVLNYEEPVDFEITMNS